MALFAIAFGVFGSSTAELLYFPGPIREKFTNVNEHSIRLDSANLAVLSTRCPAYLV